MSDPAHRALLPHGLPGATADYVRLLADADDGQPLCVLEDDVIFAARWHERVLQLCGLAQAVSPRYVITLCWYHPVAEFTTVGEDAQGRLLRWPNAIIRGSHGFVFAPGTAHSISEYWARELVRTSVPDLAGEIRSLRLRSSDCAMEYLLPDMGIPFLACYPCLLQHVGFVSTQPREWDHPSTPYFERGEASAGGSAPVAHQGGRDQDRAFIGTKAQRARRSVPRHPLLRGMR